MSQCPRVTVSHLQTLSNCHTWTLANLEDCAKEIKVYPCRHVLMSPCHSVTPFNIVQLSHMDPCQTGGLSIVQGDQGVTLSPCHRVPKSPMPLNGDSPCPHVHCQTDTPSTTTGKGRYCSDSSNGPRRRCRGGKNHFHENQFNQDHG